MDRGAPHPPIETLGIPAWLTRPALMTLTSHTMVNIDHCADSSFSATILAQGRER
jgi:hypothetical protein